jgi:CxxC motif-containing protein (DUF1111 family)
MIAVAAAGLMVAFAGALEGNHDGPAAAPTGFELRDNGFASEFCANQAGLNTVAGGVHPVIPDDECSFDVAMEEFTGPESVADGVGPVFNAPGCGECHAVPVIGGFSQTVEKRAGWFDGSIFYDPPGGSLIHDRALDPSIQEHVMAEYTNVIAFRATISALGDGFVEAISDETLIGLASRQPAAMRGQLVRVPVLEAGPGRRAIGRFGWKNQHASLVSFSADAYLNEMGITSPTLPTENTSNGNDVNNWDHVPAGSPGEPDDEGVDVELFALFMRATLAPPRDMVRASTFNARGGSAIFDAIGCNVCHTRTIVTAPAGTEINDAAMLVAKSLGNKIIHPFSDYLLHDVGTGDGIVQNGGLSTRNTLRTAALWGLRSRGRFMHDGLSLTLDDAIMRHGNQAESVKRACAGLRANDKRKLIDFLMSL